MRKKKFLAFGPQFGLKMVGEGGGGLPWVRYYYYYYYYSVFHDLDLPPFQNNVGVDPGVVTFRSSQYIKIEIDKNL